MKRLAILFAVIAVALAAISCDRAEPYRYAGQAGYSAFVTFDGETAVSFVEDAGVVEVPIRLIGEHAKAVSVSVSAKDSTAKNGTHYTLVEPVDGVLTFEPTDSVKVVKVSLVHVDGYVDPGRVVFQLNIDNVTGGLTIGSRRCTTVTIADAEHPLKAFIGTWTQHVVDYWSDEYDLNIVISADQNDIMTLNITGLIPYMFSNYKPLGCVGIGTEDYKKVIIEGGQPTGYSASSLPVVYTNPNGGNIEMEDNGDDTISIITPWGAGNGQSNGWFDRIEDVPVVLHRK